MAYVKFPETPIGKEVVHPNGVPLVAVPSKGVCASCYYELVTCSEIPCQPGTHCSDQHIRFIKPDDYIMLRLKGEL